MWLERPSLKTSVKRKVGVFFYRFPGLFSFTGLESKGGIRSKLEMLNSLKEDGLYDVEHIGRALRWETFTYGSMRGSGLNSPYLLDHVTLPAIIRNTTIMNLNLSFKIGLLFLH
jgi:hypothetical protein